jgi:hypothetical protein
MDGAFFVACALWSELYLVSQILQNFIRTQIDSKVKSEVTIKGKGKPNSFQIEN